MSKNVFYIVQYNDCYGNGDGKMFECIVKSESEFKNWLKLHNSERELMGEEPEGDEEFTLIPVDFWESLTK